MKGLYFTFYVDKNWRDNIVNKVHLYCLKHYSSVFDYAKFFIIIDDVTDIDTICSIERELVSCGFANVSFEVCKNTQYREAKVFYEKIALKLNDIEGIIMWGHNKGITNIYNDAYNYDSILTWVASMYYQNLEYIDEVENSLISLGGKFFGAFLTDTEEKHVTRSGFLYGGEFYWLHPANIMSGVLTGKIESPNIYKLDGRAYAENFPGNITSPGLHEMFSHEYRFHDYRIDYYKNARKATEFICSEDIEKFNNFYDKAIRHAENE